MQASRHQHLIIAIDVLRALELPVAQQSDLCGNVLLALCNLLPDASWQTIDNNWVRIHDIIQFLDQNYHVHYAENSRETIRKQALHHFRAAAIIEDNGMATNSPNYRYRLTMESLSLLRSTTSDAWEKQLSLFKSFHQSLIQQYASQKTMQKLPVKINQNDFQFSPGMHNLLQKKIIEDFAPRFAPNAECLYVGDTAVRDLFKNDEKLSQLGFYVSVHDKMPDIILYREDRNWLYFIEAVTSVGPMEPKRIMEIKAMTEDVTAGKIYVTAFLDLKTYKEFILKLAWETEVWIAETPDHMIHLDGDKFLEPR